MGVGNIGVWRSTRVSVFPGFCRASDFAEGFVDHVGERRESVKEMKGESGETRGEMERAWGWVLFLTFLLGPLAFFWKLGL